MHEALTVLLVDDHALFRAGVAVLLQKMPEIGRVEERGSGAEALAWLQSGVELDLVVLDYGLQDTDGLAVLRAIKSQSPELPVILLSAHVDSELIQRALREHASGFIPKTASPDVMLAAIQLVLNGGIFIPPEAMGGGFGRVPVQSPSPRSELADLPATEGVRAVSSEAQLTLRQKDVLLHMSSGLSNKEIARALNMSPSTVKVHVAAILRELQASSRTQAVILARDRGWVG